MLTALDTPADKLNSYETNFVAMVREHGWFCTSVLADEKGPSFSYTTGFWATIGMPEVVVFGLNSETAHAVLWDVYRDLKSGRAMPVAQRLADIFGKVDAMFLPVAKKHYKSYLGSSRWFYAGDDFPCIQLVWPDANNRFAWETDFNEKLIDAQPDLSDDGWSVAVL